MSEHYENTKHKPVPRWQSSTNKAVKELVYRSLVWTVGYCAVAALAASGIGLSVLILRGLNFLLN